MKRIFTCLIVLVLFFGIVKVHAEDTTCSNASINSLSTQASRVQVDYSIKNEKGAYVIYTSIYNITDKIKVTYSSNIGGSVVGTIDYATSKNGTYTFANQNITDIEKITYVITSVDGAYGCPEKQLRTFERTKPKYNKYHDYDICQYEVVQDYYYCREWITTDFQYNKKQIEEAIQSEIDKKTNYNEVSDDWSDDMKDNIGIKIEWTEEKKKSVIIISILMLVDLLLMVIQFIRIKRSEI